MKRFNFLSVIVSFSLVSCGRASYEEKHIPQIFNSDDASGDRREKIVFLPNKVDQFGEDAVRDPKLIELQQTFKMMDVSEKSITKYLNKEKVEHELTMLVDYEFIDHQAEFRQISLSPISENFYQRGSETNITDERIALSSGKKLDILLVVDNSTSMSDNQAVLAERLPKLLSFVQDTDWQIGIVTTDPNDDCLLVNERINPNTPNFDLVFKKAIIGLGIDGTSQETAFQTIVAGLSCRDSWVRSDAHLAIIIVSDEDNCSNDQDLSCLSDQRTSEGFLIDHLEQNMGRSLGSSVKAYGIIGTDHNSTCAQHIGVNYMEFIKKTNGLYGDICGPTVKWDKVLSKISKDISESVERFFYLTHPPVTGSVSIYVDDLLYTGPFELNGNQVQITGDLAAGSRLSFQYQASLMPAIDQIQLKSEPTINSVSVRMNGVVLGINDYSVNYKQRTIDFLIKIPESAAISVDYKEYDKLSTNFYLPTGIDSSTLLAKINNGYSTIESYDPNTGLLIFLKAPAENSQIVIQWNEMRKTIKTQYPLSIAQENVDTLEVHQVEDGKSIKFLYENGYIFFDPVDVTNGKLIGVSYRDQSKIDNIFELSFESLLNIGRLVLLNDKEEELKCDKNIPFTISGAHIEINCDLSDVQALRYDYNLLEKVRSSVSFDQKIPSDAEWSVYLGNTLTNDFTIEGSKVILGDEVVWDELITVKVRFKE